MTDKTRNPGTGCISIPRAALEAGKLAYERYMMDIATEEAISAAFVAMVEAWPNGGLHVPVGAGEPRKSFTLPALILPLMENPDEA